MDVGSTTVKAVVVDPATKEILWSDYQRHHTKQPEYVLSMLETILGGLPGPARPSDWRMFITGSGAGAALRAAPAASSSRRSTRSRSRSSTCTPTSGQVIELGGQDAKIIIFKKDEQTGEKTAIASMNDKCASRHGRHHRQVLPQGRTRRPSS